MGTVATAATAVMFMFAAFVIGTDGALVETKGLWYYYYHNITPLRAMFPVRFCTHSYFFRLTRRRCNRILSVAATAKTAPK